MARLKRESDRELIEDVETYLNECEENEEIPQVIRFARRHHLTKQGLYYRANKSEKLLDSIKRITEEKELVLEEGGLTGKYNSTMAIFSLKQLGWKDKPDPVFDDEEEGAGIIFIPAVKESHERKEESEDTED